MFWVYILENPSGALYVGQTDNLDERLISHNRTDKAHGKFTRKNGSWKLAWAEQHPTRSSAVCRESSAFLSCPAFVSTICSSHSRENHRH